MNEKPKPGLATVAEFVRVLDGDTYEFEIRRRFKIRLKDINCPETNEALGSEATAMAEDVLANGEEILLFIPTNDTLKLMDINSFQRLVGDVWVDGDNLASLLRNAGYDKQ